MLFRSGIEPPDLVRAIKAQDVARLTAIPGVGKKTAERIGLELKDRLPQSLQVAADAAKPASPEDQLRADLLSALLNLGYQRVAAEKADLIRELGAHQVVVHKRGEDFSPQVKRLTGGAGVDVLVDNVGTVLFEPMRRSLGTAGRWVMIGQLTGEFVPFNPAQLFLKNQSMLAVTSVSRNQLADVLALMGRGQVKAVVTQSLPLEEAAQAHTLVESGRATGRILLRPHA